MENVAVGERWGVTGEVRETKGQAPRALLAIVGVHLELEGEWRAFTEFGRDKEPYLIRV